MKNVDYKKLRKELKIFKGHLTEGWLYEYLLDLKRIFERLTKGNKNIVRLSDYILSRIHMNPKLK